MLGYALNFDKIVGDVATMTRAISISGDFTVSMWMNFDAGAMTMLGNSGTVAQFNVWSTGPYYLRFNDSVGSWNLANSRVTPSVWQHIVLRRIANSVRVYVNLNPSTAYTSSGSFSWNRVGNNNLSNYLDARLDELAIWDRALTTDELNNLYNSGKGLYLIPTDTFSSTGTLISTNLRALWHFDEGSGTTAFDSSSNNNHLLTGAEAEDWVVGKNLSRVFLTTSNILYTILPQSLCGRLYVYLGNIATNLIFISDVIYDQFLGLPKINILEFCKIFSANLHKLKETSLVTVSGKSPNFIDLNWLKSLPINLRIQKLYSILLEMDKKHGS